MPTRRQHIESALHRFIKARGAMPLCVVGAAAGESGARGRMFGRFASSQCVL
jgi:hypothetical protein